MFGIKIHENRVFLEEHNAKRGVETNQYKIKQFEFVDSSFFLPGPCWCLSKSAVVQCGQDNIAG